MSETNYRKIFKESKMWSIYADSQEMKHYIEVIEKYYEEEDEDIDQRYDVSKPFAMVEPMTSIVHLMYCITLIASDEDMNAISKTLGLINC